MEQIAKHYKANRHEVYAAQTRTSIASICVNRRAPFAMKRAERSSACVSRNFLELPNADRAVVDFHKLLDYCLSSDHPRGRHKARVFQAVLGFTSADADQLRRKLIEAAKSGQAIPGELDIYGQRYSVDERMTGRTGEAIVRSMWIIRASEDFPRLTSCYVVR